MATDALSSEDARRVALSAQGLRGARVTQGWCAGHGAPARRGAARHHLGPGPFARVGGLRPSGCDRPQQSGAGLLGTEERDVRVLVPRRLRAAARGLAGLRVQAPGPTREGQALARAAGAGQDLQRGVGASARRGPVDGQRARRRQEGRSVVGLVRDKDRRRVAARHRRAGLPRAARLRPCLRPGRAGHPGRAPGPGLERRGVRGTAGRGGRALARRGDGGRPGGVPRRAACTGAPGAGFLGADGGVGRRVEAGRLRRSRRARARWAPGCGAGR